jgi:hypothetical protein
MRCAEAGSLRTDTSALPTSVWTAIAYAFPPGTWSSTAPTWVSVRSMAGALASFSVAAPAALLAALVWVLALGAAAGVPAMHLITITWLVVAYSASGLVAWRWRPHSRFGPLMVLTGAAALAGSVIWADEAGVLHTVGQATDVLPLVLIVHVFVTFPTGRLHGRAEKLIIGAGYVAAVGGQLTAMLLGGLSPHRLEVADQPGLALVIYKTELW